MTEAELRISCAALLAADPMIKDPGMGDGDRRLSSFTADAEGWCGFVEETVTTWLITHGFDAEPMEVGSGGRVAFFGVHYLTRVTLAEGDYVVDFTASQIPGVHIVPFPVIGSVAEYLEWFGLVAS